MVVFILVNKLYYPSLPIDNLSAKEAIEKLKSSDGKIVEIATEDDYIWYITGTENEGILIADDNIIGKTSVQLYRHRKDLIFVSLISIKGIYLMIYLILLLPMKYRFPKQRIT
ncbi:hypothetical protein QTL97_15775 [Sporosarcina thermotolerans]|uniref:Uncharacterized protein n=1 Tax=Sporosarcina thermotolerans TaxID=633404 RepID=A0AAW9AH53_9BACL|nr:hypothetical protein [Sporosarcina thermotolerans]MDW0118391.1 hypothetical protein [Sporosarcina thermotolerans]WHT49441.1 hypothetical protein QNH10_07885 [Sporosarcina thermotolerans]